MTTPLKPEITPETTPTVQPDKNEIAFQMNQRLGRGVNLGNALEAPREGEWGMVIEDEFFKIIKSGGFQSIRLPIRWNAHALEESPYTISPEFFQRIDHLVGLALEQDLFILLDFHHYGDLLESPQTQHERFLSIWDQIARHYQNYPEEVFFEVLNEPNGLFGNLYWNDYLNDALDVVRQSNPDRMIVVGGGNWNNFSSLSSLDLPENDRNIIATFHYYLPFSFTHQGAEWAAGSEAWLGQTWDGSEFEQRSVRTDFDQALRWSQTTRRPVFMGEFGAYSRADMDSRARWTAFIAREAEQRGFSWAYWEFGAGFGVYDREVNRWIEPIWKALIP